MDPIQHKFVQVQGLKLHVAEIGAGKNPAHSSQQLSWNYHWYFDHWHFILIFRSQSGGVSPRIPWDMVLVAPPDDLSCQRRIPGHRTRLQRIRAIRPATCAGKDHVCWPYQRPSRNPGFPRNYQGTAAFTVLPSTPTPS